MELLNYELVAVLSDIGTEFISDMVTVVQSICMFLLNNVFVA